jgi:hypothetical protein
MLYMENFVVYWTNYVKQTNLLRGQNTEFHNVTIGATYNSYWAVMA